jgi:hypothetical protein
MGISFQIIGLSSLDPNGSDTRDEPRLSYPDALKTAQEFKAQGKAFRVFADDGCTDEQMRAFVDLGAIV